MRLCASRQHADVSILIPTHNRVALLKRTLQSLLALEIPAGIAVEIIVIANACTDATADVSREVQGAENCRIRVVDEPRPGLNRARTRGVAAASSELIAFLDDDVWVEAGWLDALLSAARNLPAQVFAGRVTLEWETGRPAWASPDVERLLSINDLGGETKELAGSNQLVGANFAIRRSVFEKVGGFQPGLDRCGTDLLSGGESELVWRALSAGNRLFYVPAMAVRHWVPAARATVKHLKALAFGRGRSRVALDRKGSREHVLASARLGIAQAVLGGIRAAQGSLGRQPARRVAGVLLSQRGLGAVFALLQVSEAGSARAWARRARSWLPVSTRRRWIRWGSLRRVMPVSRRFGFDRGRPIDRYYIEGFLSKRAADVRGRVLEIGDNTYTQRFGRWHVTQSDVLHAADGNPKATIVADLAAAPHIPSNLFDCVICTQTLPYIYDAKAAVSTLARVLKPGGVLLVTLPGIFHISRHDMDRWGDFWRFTSLSAQRLFEEAFEPSAVTVESYGNVLTAVALLQGLAVEDLQAKEIEYRDPDYEVTIALRAVKAS